jgi:hypothetical protein
MDIQGENYKRKRLREDSGAGTGIRIPNTWPVEDIVIIYATTGVYTQ